MKLVLSWFSRLFELLSNQRGDTKTGITIPDPGAEGADGSEGEGEGEGDGSEGADDDAGEGEGEGEGSDEGDGRESHIPRDRFDKVNDKAKRVEALLEQGILEEDEDGELRVNPEHGRSRKSKDEGSEDRITRESFRFKKEEVDEESWSLVEKINKGFDYYESLAQQMAFRLGQTMSENAIIRDYPEFIQKDSPLRKKAMNIMKNDPEFKKKYRGDPERAYWAVKRAAEVLVGKKPTLKPKGKNKSKFITPKGDAGSNAVKRVDISTLSKDALDELERDENERINKSREQR